MIEHDPNSKMPVTFYEQGDLEQTRVVGHVIRSKMAENISTIFSLSNLFAFCAKNQKRNGWNKLLQSLKENSSWKLFCHRNTREKTKDFQS